MISTRHTAECHSHLYNSLRSYLDNQSRAQPIIGLTSITEVLACGRLELYFCEVCFLRISKADIRNHIMGSIHKYNYIKSHHAHGWRSYTDLTLLARPLMNIARMVEKNEGTGDIQVLHVSEITYDKITSLSLTDAFVQIKMIKAQQKSSALHFYDSQFEDNETSIQEQQAFGSTDEIGYLPHLGCTLSAQSEGPVEPLSPCQDVSTPMVDSSRKPSLESSLGQQMNGSHQPAVTPGQIQSLQRHTIPPENQCVTDVRPISVIKLSRQWSPISISEQNDIIDVDADDGNEVSCELSYETHSNTTTPYEVRLQTSSLSVSHMTTQDLFNRYGNFRNVSSHTLTRTLASQSNSVQSDDKPINTGWKEHVEAKSDRFAEENRFLFSQTPIPQFPLTRKQRFSKHFQTFEDFIQNYKGPKPLIGLQAVIKCQSVDGNPPPFFFLCQLCSMKLRKNIMFRHLKKPLHRRNYLKVLHPHLLPKKQKPCLTKKMLEDIVIRLEKEDGRGRIKVMRLSDCLYSEIQKKDFKSCMNVLNCGAGVEWRSDLLSFKEGTAKSTGPSQTLKRPAEKSEKFEKSPIRAPDEAPTQHTSKKLKQDHPNTVMCAIQVTNPVFKVSLSLQEGPVVIERAPLRDTTTVAPEIEDRKPASTDENPLPLETDTHSEAHMCVHGCPHTVYSQYPEVDQLVRTEIPPLTHTHTDMSSNTDSRIFEGQFVNPAQYGNTEQNSVQSSFRPEDCSSVEEALTVTYSDWPMQDWSLNNNQWRNRYVYDPPGCAGYMQY